MQNKALLYVFDASVKSHACGGTDTCLTRLLKNDLERLPGPSVILIFTLTLERAGGFKIASREKNETCCKIYK